MWSLCFINSSLNLQFALHQCAFSCDRTVGVRWKKLCAAEAINAYLKWEIEEREKKKNNNGWVNFTLNEYNKKFVKYIETIHCSARERFDCIFGSIGIPSHLRCNWVENLCTYSMFVCLIEIRYSHDQSAINELGQETQ